MGKSPGKWIKTLLLGKKSSKSNAVKGREKTENQKEVLVAARAPEADAIPILPAVSRPTVSTTEGNERRLEIETSETTNLQSDGGAALQVHQDIYSRGSTPQGALSDPEIERKEKAATIAQAAFRGYLARRAFKALKGIIRLQALIRGHLVRRQAVATLCCVLGIVKLQALARGRKVRYSSIGKEINEKYNLVKTQDGKHSNYEGKSMFIKEAKMSGNAFVRKLVSSSPIVMSLRLYYDSEEPNSVPNWLGRWSSSCFWKPVPQPKKISYSKTQKKFGNGPVVDSESGRPKRSVRRVPAANVDSTLVSASSEDKPKRSNLRKLSTHPADGAQENPQNEFEKVKRNLRKVHNPIVENPVQPEIDAEKPKSSRKVQNPIIENPVQPEIDAEKPKSSRKIQNPIIENPVQPEIDAEKPKSGRKIQNPIIENPVQPEVDSEKPKSSLEKVSGSSADDGLGQNKAISGEKVIKETNIMASKESNVVKNEPLPSASKLPNVADSEPPLISSRSLDTETTQVPLEVSTESKLSHGDQTVDEPKPLLENGSKDETTPVRNGDLSHKEDPASNQNNKSGKKSSILAKQERPENGLQNSPTIPSYMAATESAKAKLRAQGSPRFSQEGVDKNSATRRHSLPSSTHNKISSESPRTQRPVNSGGKGSHKSEKSMSSSRDGNVKGPEWRR